MGLVKLIFACPTDSLRAGGELSNYELIKYLRQSGYEIHVIVPKKGSYSEELQKNHIAYTVVNYGWWSQYETNPSNQTIASILHINRIIRDFKPDVFITNTLNIPVPAISAAINNIPHIWIDREFTENEFAHLKEKMYFIDALSNKVVANSKQLAQYMSQHYDIDMGQYYSYVDLSGVTLSTRKTTRIVLLGTVSSRKNQEDLVRAIGYMRHRQKDFATKVYLIGEQDKAYKDKIDKIIESEGVQDLIEFTGFVDKPWSKVGRNDIVIQTSKSESIGRTVSEAMRLGVPVIASDIPGHREAFNLGGGTFYTLGDYKDLAKKILFVLNHMEQIQKKEVLKIQEKANKTMSSKETNGLFVPYLDRVKGQDNPGRLLKITQGLAEGVDDAFVELTRIKNSNRARIIELEGKIKHQQAEIDSVRDELQTVYQSKRWKIMSGLARVVRKERKKGR